MSAGLNLRAAAQAWGTDAFCRALKTELEAVPAERLPLQQGLIHTSHLAPLPHQVRVIAAHEQAGVLRVRVGVFYAGILGGCSCADDPTPVEPQPEYCELELSIHRESGCAHLVLRQDGD